MQHVFHSLPGLAQPTQLACLKPLPFPFLIFLRSLPFSAFELILLLPFLSTSFSHAPNQSRFFAPMATMNTSLHMVSHSCDNNPSLACEASQFFEGFRGRPLMGCWTSLSWRFPRPIKGLWTPRVSLRRWRCTLVCLPVGYDYFFVGRFARFLTFFV